MSTKRFINEGAFRNSLNSYLETQINVLRAIKSNEMTWIYYYLLVMLAIIALLNTQGFNISLRNFIVLQSFILIMTIGFMYILLKERESYYNVLRQVIRIENYLGFFGYYNSMNNEVSGIVLRDNTFNSAFPVGYGPEKTENGTKPYSSFLWRMLFTLLIYLFFIVVTSKENLVPFYCQISMIIFPVFFLIYLFKLDNRLQVENTLKEKGLLGAEESWF